MSADMDKAGPDYRAFRGVWIPAEVWLSDELTLQEKVMLVEINSLQHPERGCFKSNRALGEFFQLSVSRVSEIVSSLASKGHVRIESITNGRQLVERRIFMTTPLRETEAPPSGKAKAPFGKGEGPPSGKAKVSNTVLRNTERGIEELLVPSAADDTTRQPKNAYPEAFERAWQAYPTRAGGNNKAEAFKAWKARIKAGVSADDIHAGVLRYAAFVRASGKIGTEYVKQAATFFGPAEHWREPWADAAPNPSAGRWVV